MWTAPLSPARHIKAFYIPATKMAAQAGTPTLANMIIVGKMMKESGAVSLEGLEATMKKFVPAKHADLVDANMNAIMAGYNYAD